MRVSIVVPGRWHAFESAAYFAKTGVLERLVTNYPHFKTRKWGIPDKYVSSLSWHYALSRAAWELGGEALDIRTSCLLSAAFSMVAPHFVGNPDIIHSWSTAALGCLKRRRKRKWKVILDRASAHRLEQDAILSEEYESLGLKWPKRPRFGVRNDLAEYEEADAILVPSIFVKGTFLKHGVPGEKLFLNTLGVDLANFYPSVSEADTFRIVFAGSLSIRKGVHYLLEAFQIAAITNSELVLIGGATPQILPFFKNPVPGLILRGHLPQRTLAEEYRKASVFVMPSIEEGQAMVQLQALSCGLPLICTTSTGGEDLLRSSGSEPHTDSQGVMEFPAGYVVPPKRADLLAGCLQSLASNSTVLSAKREAALRFRNGAFSWHDHARRNVEIYRKILG